DRDGTRLAATFRVADHLSRRDRPAQLLGQLDFQLVIDRVNCAGGDLFLDRFIHDGVSVAEDDRADAADPINVLVAVHVPEARPLAPRCVDWRNAIGKAARPAADQLRGAGYPFQRSMIKLQGTANGVNSAHRARICANGRSGAATPTRGLPRPDP